MSSLLGKIHVHGDNGICIFFIDFTQTPVDKSWGTLVTCQCIFSTTLADSNEEHIPVISVFLRPSIFA